jgi:hypothetical protein
MEPVGRAVGEGPVATLCLSSGSRRPWSRGHRSGYGHRSATALRERADGVVLPPSMATHL